MNHSIAVQRSKTLRMLPVSPDLMLSHIATAIACLAGWARSRKGTLRPIVLFGVLSPALIAQTTYTATLSGVTLVDGSTASGSFTFTVNPSAFTPLNPNPKFPVVSFVTLNGAVPVSVARNPVFETGVISPISPGVVSASQRELRDFNSGNQLTLNFSASLLSLTAGTYPLLLNNPNNGSTGFYGAGSSNWQSYVPVASGSLVITSGSPSPLQITTSALPGTVSGKAYSTTLAASGGSGTGYTWSVASGTMPAGFALSPAGVLSSTGTPAATAGSYPITFRVTDSASSSVTKPLTLLVQPGIQITTTTLPDAVTSQPYSTTLAASGGSGTGYGWSVASGTPPSGFALSPAGVLSSTGTPAATAGSYPITFRVTDSASNTITKVLTLLVQASIQVSTTALPDAATGQPYSTTLAASGGTGTGYSWSLASGTLPPGFTLLTSGILGTTGATPAPAQSYGFTVKVTDSANNVATKLLSLVVNPICLPPNLNQLQAKGVGEVARFASAASAIPTCLTILSSSFSVESGNRYTSATGPRIEAIGGIPPYVWQLTFPAEPTSARFGFVPSGNDVVVTAPGSLGKSQVLPSGLLPVKPGTYAVRAAVSDATNQTVFLDISMTASCKESSNDLDGDGLPDCWEVFGIDVDGDGAAEYSFQTKGADFTRRDVFVEVDWMDRHSMPTTVTDQITNVFSAKNLSLHLLRSEPIVRHTPSCISMADLDNVIKPSGFGSTPEKNGPFWAALRPALLKVIRYAVVVHCVATLQGSVVGGVAKIGGSDFLVSSGSNQIQDTLGVDNLASAFMHELGHSLGLRHGGNENVNCKPNYVSIMNYSYAYKVGPVPPALWRLDFSSGKREVLNENLLNERDGLQQTDALLVVGPSIVFAPSSNISQFCGIVQSSPIGKAIRLCWGGKLTDWNVDQYIDATKFVSADLNQMVGSYKTLDACDGGGAVLSDFDDWSSLLLPISPAAGPNASVPLSDEPSINDLEQSAGDGDNDGVNGLYDNCPYTFNPGQEDSVGDGVGDACRQPVFGDVSGDRVVNCMDIFLLRGMIGQRKGNDRWVPSADLNNDGVIDVRDLALVSRALPAGGPRCQ